MPDAYAYQAALWCPLCAADIRDELNAAGIADDGDSDTYPQPVTADHEADVPQHCDAGRGCADVLWIADPEGDEHAIGADLCATLTDDGRRYTAEIIADTISDPTPHTAAVALYWAGTYDIDIVEVLEAAWRARTVGSEAPHPKEMNR